MLTPQIMVYIMIGVLVIYCIVFQYFYGRKICEDLRIIKNLTRVEPTIQEAVEIPTTPGVIVENVPENSIIVIPQNNTVISTISVI